MVPDIVKGILPSLILVVEIVSGIFWVALLVMGPIRSIARFGNAILFAANGFVFFLCQFYSLNRANIEGPWQNVQSSMLPLAVITFFSLIIGYVHSSRHLKP